MTDRSKLLALADAVEKLTEDSRYVDLGIFAALYPDRFDEAADAEMYGRAWKQPSGWTLNRADWMYVRDLGVPTYTASLDAAMTLATGYILLHLSDIGADGLPLCRIGDGTLAPPVGEWVGIASDLPRSVVAACLRALAQAEALA